MPTTTASGTSSPLSMYFLASRPSGVLSARFFLRMSPVDIWGMPYFSTKSFACVPLPAPGGPKSIIRMVLSSPSLYLDAFHETFVVARYQVRLNLADRVECNADNDQERGAAEIKADVERPVKNVRHHADNREINRPAEGHPVEHLVYVIGRALARPDARYKPA